MIPDAIMLKDKLIRETEGAKEACDYLEIEAIKARGNGDNDLYRDLLDLAQSHRLHIAQNAIDECPT